MKWNKKEISTELVNDIAQRYGCDKLTASIFARRGILDGKSIRYFLEDDKRHFHNPFELSGMEDAVEKILSLIEEGGKILIFGDRDTDGVTSTAILVRYLRGIGADVSWRLPAGEEPYGLSIAAVEAFAQEYGSLIITVDCGISNHAEIERAAELGLDVIVTDHHEPRGSVPPAFAVINPKLRDERGRFIYPFQALAGCAVAYKLTQALDFAKKSSLFNQQICLLNTRPGNGGSWIIEVLKLRNFVIIDALTETLVLETPVVDNTDAGKDAENEAAGGKNAENEAAGAGKSAGKRGAASGGHIAVGVTRLPAFLEGQHIYTWSVEDREKDLALIFGAGVEFGLFDIAPEAARLIPSTAGKSLLRLKEMSRLRRYGEEPPAELDVFYNIFRALFQKGEGIFEDTDPALIQLAMIGTMADIMPLEDENRLIVRHGLAALHTRAADGIADLIFWLNLTGSPLDAANISWKIAPLLNSAGRMGNAALAVELLLETDAQRRGELAAQLIEVNNERKKCTERAVDTLFPAAEKSLPEYGGKLVFAAGAEIPRGVTGLTANRFCGCFKTPAIVVSITDGIATGSIRSVRGYNVQSLFDQTCDLFIDCGGHDFAGGFSLEMANWEPLLERLKKIALAMELNDEDDEDLLDIDAELPLSFLEPGILAIVDAFQPFGTGNAALTFLARGLKIIDLNFMGRQEAKHVKLTLDAGKNKWPAMYWNAAEKVNAEWTLNDTVDAVFKLTRNYFAGKVTPTLIIEDMRRSST
ncbi:MAG: single-stranded-DNA-specific exonuclease RecJ [Spirochaetaceae bacterium]|jgi:single-stranded-DNA-specific exonuclease|nr:single-stranded-DNA-specific exonuclease RecJ [Spirochaetaceae bacterium]